MNRRFDGQTAWVSGAASGIGAAVARRFVAEGANVALIDLRASPPVGDASLSIIADVAIEADVRRSIEAAVGRFGGLDIVVNGAGIVHVGPLHEVIESDWDRLMGVNLKSIFLSVKHAIPHLTRRGGGAVVNVGSISSLVGQALTPAYTASKSAVLGLTRSIALDYASQGVRCNCVCPGITDTPMLREHLNKADNPDATLAARLRRVPAGRALTPDDIARAVLYLASDDSDGVTGTSLVVDGGYLAAAEWDTGP